MGKILSSLLGLSLAISMVGCGGMDSGADTGTVGQSTSALYYSHLWDVHKVVTTSKGTTRTDYFPPDDRPAVQSWGLPVQIWDTAANANSGTIYYRMTPDGEWRTVYSSDFACNGSPGGQCSSLAVQPPGQDHPFYIDKPLNGGNWHATWGTGGPNAVFGFYANYGQGSY